MKPAIHHITPLLFLSILHSSPVLEAQQSGTMYMMHQIPQSSLLNPAVQLRCRFFVGIPVSSAYFQYTNTAFTYNDLAGTDTWNIYGVYRQMHRSDLYGLEAAVHPVSLGYRHRSLYFTFHVAEKAYAYQAVPRELVEMVLFGNASFVGETARFNGLRSGAAYLREYALGISHVLDPFWTIGARAKLLFGKAGVHTSRSDAALTTDEVGFELLLEGDYMLNSSFPYTFTYDAEGNIDGVEPGVTDIARLLLNRRNPGFAMDLGVIYRPGNRTTLAASILDLGFVRWRSDVNNIGASGSFIYERVDDDTEIVSGAFLADIRDSVLRSFDVEESRLPYGSFLPPQLFLGGSWKARDQLNLGVVSRSVIYRSKLHSSVTLTAGTDLADRVILALSWSWLNHSAANAGAALAYHGDGFQFHVSTDNFLGFFFPFDTRSLNLRAGLNLMLGCPREREKESGTPVYEAPPGTGDCSWARSSRKEKRMQRKAERLQNARFYVK